MSPDSTTPRDLPDVSGLADVFRDSETGPIPATDSAPPSAETPASDTHVMDLHTTPARSLVDSVPPPPPPPPPVQPPSAAPPPMGSSVPLMIVPATPPTLTATVLITFFFGLFGLIPATIGSDKAKALGHAGGRYWGAFGLSYLGRIMVEVLIVLIVGVLGIPWFSASSVVTGAHGQSTPYPYTSVGSTVPAGGQTGASYSGPTPSGTIDSPYVAAGSWVTVLDSVSQSDGSLVEARAVANLVSAQYGATVYVVNSGSYPGLNSGYWAVVMIGYSSNEQARAACSQVGRVPGDDCYGRKITG